MKKKLESIISANSPLLRRMGLVFIIGGLCTARIVAQQTYIEVSTSIIDLSSSSSQFADLDHDGHPDLIVTGRDASGTSFTKLYINDGIGGLTEKTGQPFIDVDGGPESIAVGDVNGDMYLDVFIAGRDNSGTYQSTLYLNDGSGNFTLSTISSFSAGLDVTAIFGDFVKDGHLDLFLAGGSGASAFSSVYENDGSGTFTLVNSLLGGSIPSADTADINGNGNLDIMLNSSQAALDNTQLYLGNGDGTFVYPSQNYFNATWGTVRFADMNGDSHPDLLVTGEDNGFNRDSLSLYFNDGLGGLTLDDNQHLPGVWNGDVEFVDLDADGDQDLILVGRETNVTSATRFYVNDGTGNFTLMSDFDPPGLQSSSVSAMDIDGDDFPEIFISGLDESGMVRSILYESCFIDNVEINESVCVSYDFNGVTRSKSGTYNATFTNQAGCDSLVTLNLTILNEEHHNSIYTSASSFEFDGNILTSTGYYDATFTNQAGCDSVVHLSLTFESNVGALGTFTWFEPINSNGETPVIADFDPFTEGNVRMGDLDGDGDLDIVTNGVVDYDGVGLIIATQTKIYLNDGSSNFIEKSDAGLIGRANGDTELFDVDGDGDLDILQTGRVTSSENLSTLYLNNGSGDFTSVSTSDLPNVRLSNIGVGDLDGDNDLDVIITGRESSTNISQIYFNDGNGGFMADTQSTLNPVNSGDIAVGDLNGDNSLDIVITGTDGANRTSVYINDGSGVFTEDIGAGIDNRNLPVDLLDVDQNNTLDVLIQKKVFLNDGTGTFTEDVNKPLGSFINPAVRLVEDVNQDGIQDLILFRTKGQVLYGDGLGSFTLSEELPRLSNGAGAVGDLDGDGYSEIVVSGEIASSDEIDSEVYINDGSGRFIQNELPAVAELSLGDAAFADLDGDGDLDLITCGNLEEPHDIHIDNEESTKLYFNDGTGIFTEDISHPFYHVSGEVVLEDFNGDGTIDALVTGHEYNSFTPDPYAGVTGLYLNNGSGQFTLKTDAGIQADTQFLMAEAADLDNDGDMDLVLNAKLMINDGTGLFTESANHDMINVNFGTMSFGDVDNDGFVDLFRSGDSLGGVSRLYLNDGSGGLYWDTSNGFKKMLAGVSNLVDMDGDGDLDLFVSGRIDLGITEHEYGQIYFNDGLGNFTRDEFNTIFNAWDGNSEFSDLDGDGDQDLIILGFISDDRESATKIYLNNGLGNFKEYEYSNMANIRLAALEIADVDGNGSPDIFISGYRSNTESRLYRNFICQNGNFVNEIIELEVEACQIYYFFGAELTTSGQYQHIESQPCGTSITTNLNLTILEPISSNEDVEACESYDWNGTTYTASGTYQELFTSAAGCDSTAILNLVILESDEVEETLDHCGDYQFGTQLLTESGTYLEIFQNMSGCDSTVTLTFGHVPIPTAEIAVNGVLLLAQEVTGATYQWYDCDTDEPISGENQRQLTPPRTGEYYVEVSNGMCAGRSDCILYDWVLSTSQKLKREARVYPTTVTNAFTLDLNNELKQVSVRILSMSGNEIFSHHYKSLVKSELSFQGEGGMYVVQVESEGHVVYTQRIFKK